MVRNVTFLKSGFFAQKETKEICLRSCVWSVQHCYLQKIMVAGHEKLDKSQCCQPIANEQKGLVDFQSIRANWNKKISVIATEKPSLPPNRVFSGPTFDFR